MIPELTLKAEEEGTYVVDATLRFSGATLSMTVLTWTLTDLDGNVINNRLDVALTPAATVMVILSGPDLAIGTNGIKRQVLLKGTYNSSLGNGLSLRKAVRFEIENLAKVP